MLFARVDFVSLSYHIINYYSNSDRLVRSRELEDPPDCDQIMGAHDFAFLVDVFCFFI